MCEFEKLQKDLETKRINKIKDSLKTEEDLADFIRNSTAPHYTELKQGQLWLMKSGRIAHLIADNVIGDLSFIFKYTDEARELIQTYPGYLGVKDEPLVNYEFIRAYETNVLNATKEKIQNNVSKMIEGILK